MRRSLAIGDAAGLSAQTALAIVDFGATATKIAIFNRWGLHYSRVLAYGAAALDEALMSNLSLSAAAANQEKTAVGLVDPDHKIFTVLLKALVPLRDELKITFDYYERWSGQKLKLLYLAGGGSQLRGLPEYLKANLELPTQLAHSSFLNQPLVYLEAIGLAFKAFEKRQLTSDLNFHFSPPAGGERWRFSLWLGLGLGLVILVAAAGWRFTRLMPVAPLPPVVSPEVILTPSSVATSSSEAAMPTVTVATTSTGWLNVRAGPGTNFEVLTRIYPDEVYPLLATEGDWARIKVTLEVEEIEGWVNTQYIIKN